MREVLFRGKTERGEWVYGNYCGAEYLTSEGIEHLIIEVPRSGRSAKVLPETVGQYTGLTDKNGKKIFEGDIVAGAVHWLERMKNGFVAFKDGSFGLIWYRGEVAQFNPFTSMCNVEYEVIGNIHDNPELLNGDE